MSSAFPSSVFTQSRIPLPLPPGRQLPSINLIHDQHLSDNKDGSSSSSASVLFIPGFLSCASQSRKVEFLRAHCRRSSNRLDLFSYDPEGLATSSTPEFDFSRVRFEHWLEDASLALDAAAARSRRVVVVGSSMGGTVALRLAHAARERQVWKLLLLCPSMRMSGAAAAWKRELRKKSPEEKEAIENGASMEIETNFIGRQLFSQALVDSLTDAALDPDVPSLDIRCPVTILHGLEDDVVAPEGSRRLQEAREGLLRNAPEVDLVLRRGADHRFSEPKDLRLMAAVLDNMVRG